MKELAIWPNDQINRFGTDLLYRFNVRIIFIKTVSKTKNKLIITFLFGEGGPEIC